MIQIEITKSPDLNVIYSFEFQKNDLYIGNSSGDLIIQDPELKKSHLMLEVIEKELIIHPQSGVEYFLLNGKRTTTIKKIKASDKITIGKTEIKIISFSFSIINRRKEILNDKLAKLIDIQSARLPVIEQLSKMMK